jgi:hypothetical protein
MPDEKPTSLTARNKPELADIFRRHDAKEFRLCAMEYGHGRPGKPFCKLGVIWPTERQGELIA